MSEAKKPKQRRYRVIVTGGFWKYHAQVRRLGMWWYIGGSDHEGRAKAHCERHAQNVVWEGLLP